MGKAIYKYTLAKETGTQFVEMPKDSVILSVQQQNDNVCIWALVNPNSEMSKKAFTILFTGVEVKSENLIGCSHLATIQMPSGIVIHVFIDNLL